MATSSPNSSTTPSSLEETGQLVRHICHHGFRTSDEIQQAIDSHFLPYADQILALPKTTYFTDKPPFRSVVSWALAHKCYPLLRFLIYNGWEMNHASRRWMIGYPSLLGELVVLRDIELTRFLLAQGIDPCVGETPRPAPITPIDGSKGWLLHLASMFSSLETFKLLHSYGANLSYAHALHGAAYSGPSQIPIIRHLLDSKAADVDELDVYHVPHTGTPLLAAIMRGHVEVVRVLLEYGAHPLACIVAPYETNAEKLARGLETDDEGASKEILKMLEEARREREREGRLGGVPVTGRRRPGTSSTPDLPDTSSTSGTSVTSGTSSTFSTSITSGTS